MKDVHDHVDVIEQHPPPLLQTLDVVWCDTITMLETLHDMFGRGSNVSIGGPAGNDEKVGGVGDARKVEEDDVSGLQIVRECGSPLGGRERRRGRRFGHSETVQDTNAHTASALVLAGA